MIPRLLSSLRCGCSGTPSTSFSHLQSRLRLLSTLPNDSRRPPNKTRPSLSHRSLDEEHQAAGRRSSLYTVLGMVILASGLTYASVPIFRRFCQQAGGGWGTAALPKDKDKVTRMKKMEKRLIRVQFQADKQAKLQWEFKPLQDEVWVHPGETSLIFYSARNPTTKPVVGISTYTVVPYEAGLYFAKIQCFCFEEQMLMPGEQVDMPVFFYIDPDFVDDPLLESSDTVTLSYTFFESKDGVGIPPNPYQAEHKILTKIDQRPAHLSA